MTATRAALSALTATALLCLVAPLASAADPASPPGEAIKGLWAVESISYEGYRAPDDRMNGAFVTAYDGKEYLQRQGGTVLEMGTYVVDPSKTPGTIDLKIQSGPNAGKTQLGLFELDGDSLRVVLAAPGAKRRPKSMDASGTLRIVNRRYRR